MSTHSSKFSVPLGYRFNPSEEEILGLLGRAIRGEPLPSSALTETEIYGENREPWNLFDKDANKSFRVLTKLKNRSRSKFDRTAGCGFWFGRGKKDVKDAHGQLLGFDRNFGFICKNDESSQGNGHWIMHEYSLCDEGLSDYAICKITNRDTVLSNHQENQENKVEPQNKKHKAPEVKDDEESSNPNQANADERNGSRALIIYDQQNSGNLVGREIPDLNLVPTMTSNSHQSLGQTDSTNISL